VFQHGRHNSGRLLAVRSIANGGPWTRHAYAIPKRVGKAVVRNKLRRRLREIMRSLSLPEGYDIVVSVRQPANQATFQELRTELTLLLKRARLVAMSEQPEGAQPRPPALEPPQQA
jgi:ribonuclease P protein component